MAAEHMKTTRREIEVDGIRTTLYVAGDGPALVLLHNGYMGKPDEVASAVMWAPVFHRLAEHFTVIAIDRLGQGRTDNPASADDYSLEASKDHALKVIRALGHDRVHLVGHDEGAFVAAQLAIEEPELVASVALVVANALTPGVSRRNVVHAHPPRPYLGRTSLRWMYETACHSILAVRSEWMNEAEEIATLDKTGEAIRVMSDGETHLRTYVAQWTAKRSALHRQFHDTGLPCPTLLVWGLNDPVAPLENGKYLLELLTPQQRDTEIRIFNTAGHFPHWEHPETFARVVGSYAKEAERHAAGRAASGK
ncbi:alpha/beta fold hydrolase [Sagittula stellata]|uniref:Alpha/beta hydrolase fold protein n=1 Tax=Sagittula stellata (strain ATCC 700073 / DSM 11524 / E-37) TaxID=388399 RepID=A3K4U8_SAGS3|nr:alpha/beta hydrolase [Sagittula stellata]EBA07997.1 alpha/beta hydrolase fold protein [Sagittula stellata E-37]